MTLPTQTRRPRTKPAGTPRKPGVQGVVSGVVGLSAPAAAVAAHAPWWAVIALSALSLAVTGLQTCLPQDSGDRLAWWKDRRRHRERLLRHAAEEAT